MAAVIDTYAEKLALSDESKHFERIQPVFTRAAAKMEKNWADRNWEEFCSLARHLGQEALSEQSDWLEMHRERALPAPKG